MKVPRPDPRPSRSPLAHPEVLTVAAASNPCQAAMDVAVYARHVTPRRADRSTAAPVSCGGVVVHPGDVLFGDADRVIVVASDAVIALTARALEIRRAEAEVLTRLRSRTPLRELTNLDEHWERRLRGEDSALQWA
jgi:4-hydroxy-4-methyl-2-oxoglutarate aldolase